MRSCPCDGVKAPPPHQTRPVNLPLFNQPRAGAVDGRIYTRRAQRQTEAADPRDRGQKREAKGAPGKERERGTARGVGRQGTSSSSQRGGWSSRAGWRARCRTRRRRPPSPSRSPPWRRRARGRGRRPPSPWSASPPPRSSSRTTTAPT